MILTKMQAAGNDFLLVNGIKFPLSLEEKTDLARTLCRRRLSFGADGMIFLDASEGYDFGMDFYNADGSKGEMCGNGARCLARFAYEEGLVGEVMHFSTPAGPLEARRLQDNLYSLSMQLPSVYEEREVEVMGRCYRGSYVELGEPGVPHFCLELDEIPKERELRELAEALRHHREFDKGSNVNFFFPGETTHVLTYERGVEDFTLACGTGVTSVAYTILMKEELEGMKEQKFSVPGGELSVISSLKDRRIKLELLGPVEIVYRAEYARQLSFEK